MKKITLLLLSCFFITFINAEVILDEAFDYDVAALKDAVNWSESSSTSGLAAEDGIFITIPALSYSDNENEYILSAEGKTIKTEYFSNTDGANDYRVYRDFTDIKEVIYVSFLYKGEVRQSQTQSDVITLSKGTGIGARLWAGKTSPEDREKVRFGVTTGSGTGSDIKWGTNTYSIADVHLIVLKHDLTNNITSLFVDPTLAENNEPLVAEAQDDNSSVNRDVLNRIGFRLNKKSQVKFNMGGLRISTTWAEAVSKKITGLPQLDTPVVGSPSNVKAESFTANWIAVTGATGYDVKVYEGENIVINSNVIGQDITSLDIRGLWTETEYAYKVIAKGDGTTTADSEESAASALFTTLAGLTSISTDFGDGTWGTIEESSTPEQPSYYINGFEITSANIYKGSIKGLKGETHANRINLLKQGGSVVLPIVQSLEQVEIHMTAGSAGNGFNLKEFDTTTNQWVNIGDRYNQGADSKASGLDTIFIIPVSRSGATKLKIENPTNGGVYIWQIITRTTNPVLLDMPVAGDATELSTVGFTSNWTAVANANAYDIKVYGGTTLINTYKAEGQSATSLTITGLERDSTYTYTVQAKGDNDVNYLDSYLSKVITVKTLGIITLETPVAGAATEITKNGFTANWATVDNAAGYNVMVYGGTTLVNTYIAEGQSTNNLAIMGLESDSTYTYKVQAHGDDEIYADSDLSQAITVKTLPDGGTSIDEKTMTGTLYALNNRVYTSQPGMLEIYDIKGSLILHLYISDKLDLGLQKGIYILRLQADNGNKYSEKIQIQ